MVTGSPHREDLPDEGALVYLAGSTTAILLSEHRYPIAVLIGGITTQAVLPDETGREHEVEVSPGLPEWKFATVGILEFQGDNALGFHAALAHDHRPGNLGVVRLAVFLGQWPGLGHHTHIHLARHACASSWVGFRFRGPPRSTSRNAAASRGPRTETSMSTSWRSVVIAEAPDASSQWVGAMRTAAIRSPPALASSAILRTRSSDTSVKSLASRTTMSAASTSEVVSTTLPSGCQ